ncbi:MAG: GTPase family protein [Xanthobacteraceae bacterium]
MNLRKALRRYWPETLLVLAVAFPWLSLLALGGIWLWQRGHTWAWAIAAAASGLLAWALFRLVRRRTALEQASREPLGEHLGDIAEPSSDWNAREREIWLQVEAIAQATPPFNFTEIEPFIASAHQTITAVARSFHPEQTETLTEFTLPEVLLLTERVSRRLRGKALRSIPFVRQMKIGRVVWVWRTIERYGPLAQAGYRLWRLGRVAFDPVTALLREIGGHTDDRMTTAVFNKARIWLTQAFVLEVGRAAIDLYSGRLALSPEELREAAAADVAPTELPAPVRLLLAGQVNAGKSSLVNALAHEVRCAAGPVPTTSRATEYLLEVDGRPAVSIVDTPGIGENSAPEVLAQAGRADLIVWVASATQPARGPDRRCLDEFRTWAGAQLHRRPPNVIVALTHIDELRPASEWTPPYDVAAPTGAKARTIRAAIDATATALALPAQAIVPVAMPPGGEPYNIDALWAGIAVEIDQAKLVQLDRLLIGGRRLSLRELAGQLGHAGRFVLETIAKA